MMCGILFALLAILPSGYGQPVAPRYISIGRDGIMHDVETGAEVTGFGVNYTVPFAHAYRTGKAKDLDLKAEIDRDVYHFARLGLDLFRVHVWDCEISDTLGNLLDNEHLELFDYLLYQLGRHGIRSMITPIAYWGNGWPDPDEKTPGFSAKYGKEACLTDPDALAAQERYLAQFVSHVNRYTGVAYKYDPNILLFEISNEPHHRGTPDEVHTFINTLSKAIRDAGCIKPVFYNVTHSVHLAEAYADSRIDGGTFQWYPTGLGFQKPLQGNMLPNVDDYAIPFDSLFRKKGLARIVYEFDAADMTASYMYPAMARSFRTAGIQLATHFSYDPTYLAPYNTEYNTHYMNLLYAPRKALALMLCAEIFRQVPLYADYGRYPANTQFGPFRIDPSADLAEMVTDQAFIYTNHTSSAPLAPERLTRIAGWGNSPIVRYDGTGAYFLDKIEDGAWLLEVFPDAAVTDNLFGRNSTDIPRSTILTHPRTIQVNLPGLSDFVALQVDDLNRQPVPVVNRSGFTVTPGKYLLISDAFMADDDNFNVLMEALAASPLVEQRFPLPAATLPAAVVRVDTFRTCTAGKDLTLRAEVITLEPADSVNLLFFLDNTLRIEHMTRVHGFTYEATIPGKDLKAGEAGYAISVARGGLTSTFPGNISAVMISIEEKDNLFPLTIVTAKTPVNLLEPATDQWRLNRQWSRDIDFKPTGEGPDAWFSLQIRRLIREDEENLRGPQVPDYSIRHAFADRIKGRRADVADAIYLVVECSSPLQRPFQVALVQDNGIALGALVKPEPGRKAFRIRLRDLKPVPLPILPRPYPTFLPYYFPADPNGKLDMSRAESLILSFGPGLQPGEYAQTLDWEIGRIFLRK
jgi:hypothetical protein